MNLNLETERLLLSPFRPENAEIWVALRTDPEVMKFIRPPRTPEQALAEARGMHFRGAGGALGFWCISERVSGDTIGTGILLPLPLEARDPDWFKLTLEDLKRHEIEVGYHLIPSAWGKGYATEAAKALITFAFEETPLDRILAVTNPENEASQRVLRKAGLIDTGPQRAYGEDVSGFEITRREQIEDRPADEDRT